MTRATEELDPLVPDLPEVVLGFLSVLAVLHVALIAVVVLRLLAGRGLPRGVLGLLVLLYVPVVGPILVLTWQRRAARERAQASASDAASSAIAASGASYPGK